MQRFTVFCGNFGSGKTELAMAYAKKRRMAGNQVILVDMDVVNPYFTSSNQREMLTKLGIRVISPNFSTTGVDVPSLSPEVFSVFSSPEAEVVFDLGGDPIGALALGTLSEKIKEMGGAEVWFVLNPYRPLVRKTEDAMGLLRAIEEQCRLRVTGVINNANLGAETEKENLLYGEEAAWALADRIGVPVVAYGVMPELQCTIVSGELTGKSIVAERANRLEWML